MLKENKNIDQSYTDRVVRQLVDETEIDFKAGKVHLPATDYSWTFDHFGPGGLENALRMTASNSFGTHIINNYGIDEEEFEEVLTKFIEVIAEKINRYLAPIFNLQENKNIDWDYTDRVVKQLVDETEIDFKNRRVKLDAAEYSFPFYSFGSRRAHRENIIFEPNSKFGKHVISNYGVDETEYKEIYAMYMGIIASRLQDHDENVNHLYLHENTEFDEKEYRYATQVLDRMVRESKINTSHEDPSQWDIYAPHMGRWISPMGFISPNTIHLTAFEDYVMDIYGVDRELIGWTWNNYRKEVNKNFRLLSRKAMGDDSPQYDYLAESTEDNFLDRVLDRMVDETIVEYGEVEEPIAYPTWVIDDNEGVDLAVLLDSGYEHWNFKEFSDYVKNIYGLSEGETKNIWEPYLDGVDEKFSLYIAQNNLKHPWTSQWVNESTEENFLDTIVNQLVDETEIDYDNGIPHISAFPDPDFSMDISYYLNKDLSQNLFGEMFKSFWSHCRNVYGLTDPEIQKVWWEYKKEVLKKIEWKESLNESTEDNFLDKIVNQLVDETQVFNHRGQLRAIPPFFESDYEDVELEGRATGVVGGTPLSELIDSVEFEYSLTFVDFKYYCKQMYGLTWEECHEVWDKYREALYNTDFSHLYTPNIHLDESTEGNFLDKIVNQLVDETIIEDDEYEIPVAYPSWITDEGFGGEGVAVDILLDSDKNSVNFVEFRYYANNMYGLEEDEIPYVWDQYRSGVWDKEQNRINDYHRSLEDGELNESLNSRVKKEVDDLFDKDKKLKGEDKIKQYFEDKGLNKQDADEAMVQYLSKQQSLNESPDDLNSYIHKGADKMVGNTPYIHQVVNTMVDNTHLIYEKQTNTIMAKLPFYIVDMGFKEGHIDTIGQSYLVHPTARIVAEIRKHLILIYGMDKWEADAAALMYLSKMTEKINDYKREGLNESEDKKEKYLERVLDHLVSGTKIKKEIERDPVIMVPYLHVKSSGNVDSGFYLSSHIFHGASSYFSFLDYGKEVYGLSEDESEILWKKYVEILRDKIKHQPYKLDESVDLSYTDDKDFPFLNQLANHTMSITEIERNAVLFPFIDGYISDGNFHKYFHGTPYDQLPFEATLKLDEYLRDFGLTENEKEIWWDIYVIKVIDAINERDLRIIDSHGELNESTEDIYNKIANSIANESEIVVSPAPYNKMFLKGPAWEQAQHIENVIDQLTGTIKKNAVPDRFVKHLKEIFNIEKKGYNTVVQTIWRLYRDKMIERIKIKQAQQRQINPKQEKFFDHILKTLVDETEVQTMKDWLPDDETYEQKVWVVPPFLNHGYELTHDDESVEWSDFSYFGYGYPRYMKDIYGLTDKEGLRIWAPYYKALEKKIDDVIERDRIIYGDD